jgi:hypothetical protein
MAAMVRQRGHGVHAAVSDIRFLSSGVPGGRSTRHPPVEEMWRWWHPLVEQAAGDPHTNGPFNPEEVVVRWCGIIGLLSVVACTFKPGGPGAPGVTAVLPDGSAGAGGGGGGDTATTVGCSNLACQQSTCALGGCTVAPCLGPRRTTVSGTVYDPAGKIPLANVTVYVPNAPLEPITDGPTCDPCDPITGTSLVSGQPITITKTDVQGKFTLGFGAEGDVPAGANIPLVVQVGKWRRQVTIPNVTACTNTPITDASLTRLPRDQSEGHIPKMALTTGQLDALECLLRKVGIADSEFTPETGTGRVNFYAGGGGTSSYAPSLNGGAAFTPVHPWWNSLTNLERYDIILHSCEGTYGSFDPSTNTPPLSDKSRAARQALQDFADRGGRVYASHWHVYWFEEGTPAFQSIATFNHRDGLPSTYDATIDQSLPTGQTLAQWMVNVGGSLAPGLVTIRQDASTRTVDAVAGGNVSQQWIYASTLTPPSVQYLSATTPIPGGNCGRVVFSDLHVSAGAGVTSDLPNMPFPTGCVTTDLSPQEKVLEFMLFDIASCVSPIVP